MKKLVKLLIVFTFSLVACFSLFFGIKTYAMGEGNVYSLHQQTRIYDESEIDYRDCYENIKDYEVVSPSITVLTHGLGGNATGWSNTNEKDENDDLMFKLNLDSLIAKIAYENDYNIDVYVASCTSATEFSLEKYNWKLNSQGNVDRIQSVNNHIVLVFESSRPYDSNLDVYNEFDNVIDTVSLQYKALTGKLPLLNLVGHSRGGLTNIMYATKHPYNVKQIYSMGTPYNNTLLGSIDFFISLLHLDDSQGALDILNEDTADDLRDEWNEVYRKAKYMPTVVALGGITSVEYGRSFFNEICNNDKYNGYVKKYEYILNIALELIDEFPEIGDFAVNGLNGWLNVTAFWDGLKGFFTQTYNLDTIYEKTSGVLTREQLYKLLALYSIVDGEAVILDDLFIDLNSQLGLFEDNNNYLGFSRLTKVFTKYDYLGSASCPSEPKVVHNVESMNKEYTDLISQGLSYGTGALDVEEINEFGTFSEEFLGEKVVVFNPAYSGKRSISTNAKCTVYENGRKLRPESGNIYYFAQGKSYEIVISNDEPKNVTMSLDVASIFGGAADLNSKESYIYKLSGFTGFKTLYAADPNIKFMTLDGDTFGVAIGDLSNDQYVIVKQETNSSIYTYLQLKDPKGFDDNGNNKYSATVVKNGVVVFTNPNTMTVDFFFTVAKDINLSFFTGPNAKLTPASVVSNSQTKIYRIILKASEKIYVQSSGRTSIQAEEDMTKLYWYVNGAKITSSVLEVYNSTSYTIVLKRYASGKYYELEDAKYLLTNTNYVECNGTVYSVKRSAKIGSEASIVYLGGAKTLTLKVVPTGSLSYSIVNTLSMYVHFSFSGVDLSTNKCFINFKCSSGNGNYTENYSVLVSGNGQVEKSLSGSSLTKFGLKAKMVVTGIEINSEIYGGNYFSNINNSTTFNAIFFSGDGTSSSPYLIDNSRHLKNISLYPDKYYKLNSNIYFYDKWDKSIIFTGDFDGNNKSINTLWISANQNGNFGLFKENRGIVKNLTIKGAKLSMDNVISTPHTITCGYIAGKNTGDILNCKVVNSTMTLELTTVTFGFIAGRNTGDISSCKSESNILTSSNVAGGIVGANTGTVESCTVKGIAIKYVENGVNGEVGGAVGSNSGTVNSTKVDGTFYWHVKNGDDTSICPWLGKLIGHNNGTISECSATMNPDVVYGWRIIFWPYDQGGHCFKGIENGLVG